MWVLRIWKCTSSWILKQWGEVKLRVYICVYRSSNLKRLKYWTYYKYTSNGECLTVSTVVHCREWGASCVKTTLPLMLNTEQRVGATYEMTEMPSIHGTVYRGATFSHLEEILSWNPFVYTWWLGGATFDFLVKCCARLNEKIYRLDYHSLFQYLGRFWENSPKNISIVKRILIKSKII